MTGFHSHDVTSLNQGGLRSASWRDTVTVDLPLFADGFEDGDTSAWSLSHP